MNYTITNMTEEILNEIISWKYEDEYNEYNMDFYEKLQSRGASILDSNKSNNYLCYFKDSELVGYTNIVRKNNGKLFLGIGLAPKYRGKGLGKCIIQDSIETAKQRYPGVKITLQVRSWNKRVIKCYENAGFKIKKIDNIQDYNGIETEFVFMEL